MLVMANTNSPTKITDAELCSMLANLNDEQQADLLMSCLICNLDPSDHGELEPVKDHEWADPFLIVDPMPPHVCTEDETLTVDDLQAVEALVISASTHQIQTVGWDYLQTLAAKLSRLIDGWDAD